MSVSSRSGAHVFLFPFPTSGHIIPLLDLANLLLTKGLTVTILIPPPNLPLVQPFLSKHPSTSIHPLILPFPESFYSSGLSLASRIQETSQLHDPLFQWFQSQPSPPVAIVSDFFLGWTHHLAAQLGVQRLAFWPSGAHDSLILHHLWHNLSDNFDQFGEDSLITFPNLPNSPVFPFWKASQLVTQSMKGEPNWEFYRDNFLSNSKSWGVVFNTFKELEGQNIDSVKKELSHDRVWAVGPLVLSSANNMERGGSSSIPLDDLLTWLDDKATESVVYVCFGSRVVLTSQQTEALGAALECSGVHFIWRVKELLRTTGDYGGKVSKEFEDRMAGKGLIIRGWAPQVEILEHRAVGAFLTHCGWNSVLEGVCAGVVLLAWPMGADQFANARLLVDELGLAIRACEGGPKMVPESTKLGRILAESVASDNPKKSRAKEMKDLASIAVQDGGSSSQDLDELIKHLNDLQYGNSKTNDCS